MFFYDLREINFFFLFVKHFGLFWFRSGCFLVLESELGFSFVFNLEVLDGFDR